MKTKNKYFVDIKGKKRSFKNFGDARKYYHSFLPVSHRIMFTRHVVTECDFIQNGDVKIYYKGSR